MSTVTNAASSALNQALSNSGAQSAEEKNLLSKLSNPDRDRMEAQLALQKQQETVAFISKSLKNDTAMQTINNLK